MKIGIPKETKVHEYRVSLLPESIQALARDAEFIVETGAGNGVSHSDEDYQAVGAQVVQTAAEVFAKADLIVKVKEPQPNEVKMLQSQKKLFTYLHLAAAPELTQALMERQVTSIAYETVTSPRGDLPMLTPMSIVAGRMAPLVAAQALMGTNGGRGILPGGVPGAPSARFFIFGGGVAGTNAAKMAKGLGARVTVIDRDPYRLHDLDELFMGQVETRVASPAATEEAILEGDCLIGAVLIPGHTAPRLISRADLKRMKTGAVLVDIAIDQGGCFESSRPTTHADPTYLEEGIVHYCVANMPGAAAHTSTAALNAATAPFLRQLITLGVERAMIENVHLRRGLSTHKGFLTEASVGESLGLAYVTPEEALGMV